jgi:branched-chain amino acid transport system substrate-binding protein
VTTAVRSRLVCVGVWVGLVITAACRDRTPIRIGVVQSSEGEAGARLAMIDVNESGGVHGRALSLRFMAAGGQASANVAIAAAESLSEDPTVIGVVGHANSSATLSASQIYNRRQLPQIAPTSSSPLLARAGPYTFRLVASDIHQARFLADRLLAAGSPRTAVLYVNDDYGRALYGEIRARLADAKMAPVFVAPYVEGVRLPNVDATAQAIADANAEWLLWLGRTPELRQLLGPLMRRAPRIRVLAGDAVATEETESNIDGALTGIRYSVFVDLSAGRDALQSLRRRYSARMGHRLTPESALAYEATMLIATAARVAGPDRRAVRDYLASLGRSRVPYPGATRDIAFDSTGALRASYWLAEVTAEGVRIVPPGAR